MTEGTDMIENVARAIANTTDFDGDRMASRYAESELRDMARNAIAAMQQAQEPVAWRYTRADGHFFLTPKRCRDGYPEADGWSEEALYTGPTPPAGGSDAE